MSESWTVFEKPCECKAGRYSIDRCETDHGWPTATPVWYEGSVQCSTCAKKFELLNQNGGFELVLSADVADRKSRREQAWIEDKKICASPDAQAVYQAAIKKLEGAKSKAEAFRLLSEQRLTHTGQSAFVRKYAGAEDALKFHLRARQLPRLAKLSGAPMGGLASVLADYEKMEAWAAEPIPVVEVVFKIKA